MLTPPPQNSFFRVKKVSNPPHPNMNGDTNYDEFGNYIGPDLDSDLSEDDYDDYNPNDSAQNSGVGAANQAAMELQNDDIDSEMMEMAISNPEAAAEARATYLATQNGSAHINSNAIVLAEDKQYYPDASDVYGADVETLVEEEDAQPLTKPIIAPIKKNVSATMREEQPETTYNNDFLASLLGHPQLTRNIAVVGHLHSGKTSLLDLLVEQTRPGYESEWLLDEERKYTDTRIDEQKRGMSIKSCPISLVLPTRTGKSYLLNLIDCPGHSNFCAETTAGMRVSDGVVVVIDACEGIMMQTERVVREAVANHLPICLVINKMDRLITELKLPPNDAYYKIRYMIDSLNKVITETSVGTGNLERMKAQTRSSNSDTKQQEINEEESSFPKLLAPESGNVVFASSRDRWAFTTASFAGRVYNKKGKNIKSTNNRSKARRNKETKDEKDARIKRVASSLQDTDRFAKRLWGDWYSNPTTNAISRTPPTATGSKRTFVQYVLEPLWKVRNKYI